MCTLLVLREYVFLLDGRRSYYVLAKLVIRTPSTQLSPILYPTSVAPQPYYIEDATPCSTK